MSVTAAIRQSSSLGGVSFPESQQITGDGQIVHQVDVVAADPGSLTTRTDATDGTITADDSVHSILTGARVDLYWTVGGVSGKRRGVTVGTVSATSIPFSGGDGDNLPAQSSDIVICAVEELDVVVDGDNVVAVLAYSAKDGQMVFINTDVSDVEITSWNLGEGGTKMWHEEDFDPNPFAGENIGRVYISHKDTTGTVAMRLGITYNNVLGA